MINEKKRKTAMTQTMKGNCYISGPITNDPEYKKKFEKAEYEVIEMGYRPVNPTRLIPVNPNWKWEQYIREGLKHLLTCETIYMLKGWVDSPGAKAELDVANMLKMTVIMQRTKQK